MSRSYAALRLIVAVLAFTTGCAYQNPDAPTPVALAPPIPGGAASVQLLASTLSDHRIEITAKVLTADRRVVPDVAVTFTTSTGALSADVATTDAIGVARTILSSPDPSTVSATVGALSVSTKLESTVPVAHVPAPHVPLPPVDTRPTPPAPAPPPGTGSGGGGGGGGGGGSGSGTGAPFTRNGVGNTVFDMPTTVTRVRITGLYAGTSSTFFVEIGGDLLISMALGTGHSQTTTDGTYLTSGGVVAITGSTGAVTWTFAEVR